MKLNAQYYIDNILKEYLEREVPRIQPNEEKKIILHHDKITNHIAKLTT